MLPNQTDANGQVQRLAIGAGKDSNIYLVNRDNMGKFNSQQRQRDLSGVGRGASRWNLVDAGLLQRLGIFQRGGWTHPGVSVSEGGLQSTPTSVTSTRFPFPAPHPVSRRMAQPRESSGPWRITQPPCCTLTRPTISRKELYNTSQAAGGRDDFGAGNKFMVPTIANGKVYVGTPNGVAAFGLLGQ